MTNHFDNYHNRVNKSGPQKHVAAGGKFLKALMAMYDNDAVSGQRPARLQQRASQLVREWVTTSPSPRYNVLDGKLSLVLTGHGPCYQNPLDVCELPGVLRVGNIFVDRDFFELFMHECFQHHGRVKTMRSSLVSRFASSGCVVTHLLPRGGKFWLKLLECVVSSPFVTSKRADLIRECIDQDEYHWLSIDGTVRCARRIKGLAC